MDEDGLWTNHGKVVAPTEILPWLARMAHLNGQVCKRGTVRQVQESWYAPGIGKIAEGVCKSCQVCQQHNQQKEGKTREPGAHLSPLGSFCAPANRLHKYAPIVRVQKCPGGGRHVH